MSIDNGEESGVWGVVVRCAGCGCAVCGVWVCGVWVVGGLFIICEHCTYQPTQRL